MSKNIDEIFIIRKIEEIDTKKSVITDNEDYYKQIPKNISYYDMFINKLKYYISLIPIAA